MRLTALIITAGLLLAACGKPVTSEGSKRDFAFYSQFINSSDQYPNASQNLENLKVMTSDVRYSMRLAMFENGVFYYQVNNLGDGEGRWEYRDGIIRLTAVRPVFDLDLEIMAEQEASDTTIVQFIDRFRFNSVPIEFRKPADSSKPLKPFKMSDKNI